MSEPRPGRPARAGSAAAAAAQAPCSAYHSFQRQARAHCCARTGPRPRSGATCACAPPGSLLAARSAQPPPRAALGSTAIRHALNEIGQPSLDHKARARPSALLVAVVRAAPPCAPAESAPLCCSESWPSACPLSRPWSHSAPCPPSSSSSRFASRGGVVTQCPAALLQAQPGASRSCLLLLALRVKQSPRGGRGTARRRARARAQAQAVNDRRGKSKFIRNFPLRDARVGDETRLARLRM